jgi:hypothetical protein
MTTTSIISGQSIGTGADIGEGLYPQKITIAATTTAFVITPRVTNGAAGYNPGNEITVWYSSSSYSVSAAQAVKLVRGTARTVSVKPSPLAAGDVLRDSTLEPVTGSYIYLWCDIPAASVAQSLSVNVVELP